MTIFHAIVQKPNYYKILDKIQLNIKKYVFLRGSVGGAIRVELFDFRLILAHVEIFCGGFSDFLERALSPCHPQKREFIIIN